MPTDFKNELYFPNGTVGELKTVTTLKVWDCVKKQWVNSAPVILRNTLLHAQHPFIAFCIGEIPTDTKNANLLNDFKPPGEFPLMKLDMASNSRNHGRFTFCEKPVGKYYYGEDWKRIIYGSILHTGCKKITYVTIDYAIADDENRDEYGNQYDCPPLDFNFGTGDSHAKADIETMQFIEEFGQSTELNPIQYRSALYGKWVGKGTVAWSEFCDIKGMGFVQPHSSMKGNKPELGVYQGKLLFGKVFTAEQRRANLGWMFLQWFSFAILEQDKIISKLEKKCQKIVDAKDDIAKLAELLRIEQDAGEAEISNSEDDYESIAEYENMMMRIIRADKAGLLLYHPYVVRRINERLKSYWINLAKSAGMKFYSVMTMPDEYFAQYYTVEEDGRLEGDFMFCAPDFDEGLYIVFANPMRHWGDIQLWRNVHAGDYLAETGVLATGKDLLLSLGRDTDGDFVQIAWADAYPAIRDAILQFDESPTTQKLPKVALKGNLKEIAISSMNDLVGVVGNLLGRAKAIEIHYHVVKIPAQSPYYPKETEQTIINFLSQQLQIAVDSIKSAYPVNNNGLDSVGKYIAEAEKSGNGGIPWLNDLKQREVYLTRPCAVNPSAMDTVSRLIRLVNTYFLLSHTFAVQSEARDYIDTLFADVDLWDGSFSTTIPGTKFQHRNYTIPTPFQIDYALKKRNKYWADLKIAMNWRDANDGDTTKIRIVTENAKQLKEEVYEVINPDTGQTFEPRTWIRAFWYATHHVNSGDAGFIFHVFPEEILHELANKKPTTMIEVYACQYSNLCPKGWIWTGQLVKARIIGKTVKGKQYKSVEIEYNGAVVHTGFQHLGLVGAKSRGDVSIGETRYMKIFSLKVLWQIKQTKSVLLFDPDFYNDDEMIKILNEMKNKSFKYS